MFPNIQFTIKLYRSEHILAVNLILESIVENKTQKQERNMISY